jgi:cytoskeletal protein RodZ
MESVGEFFKQVREAKGLTLDEVASKTRIHPDFLKALEEGNFAKLPDQVFAKGFVRSYARSLGLEEAEAMRRFEESAGAFYNKQSELERLRIKQAEDERRRKANRKVVIAAAGVALLALVLLLSREQSTVAPKRQAAELEQATARVPEPAPGQAQAQALRRLSESPTAARAPVRLEAGQMGGGDPGNQPSAQGSAPASLPTGLEASGSLLPATTDPLAGLPLADAPARNASLILDLEAKEMSWVVVQVDDERPREALLRPGERVRWKASNRFTLTLGNAGGVHVELNGKPQGPFGPSGKVARDIVLKR